MELGGGAIHQRMVTNGRTRQGGAAGKAWAETEEKVWEKPGHVHLTPRHANATLALNIESA